MAPTEKGLVITKVIWMAANLCPQTFRTQNGTGTRLLAILRQKLPGTATSSIHPVQEMRMLRSRINLSTSGGTEILNSVITHTSLTDLVAVGKVSDGDWITVR